MIKKTSVIRSSLKNRFSNKSCIKKIDPTAITIIPANPKISLKKEIISSLQLGCIQTHSHHLGILHLQLTLKHTGLDAQRKWR